MLRRIVVSFVLITFLTGLPGGPAAAKKSRTFQDICLEVLESLQTFYPVRATEMGIHAHDFHLADYSSKSVKSMIKKLKGFEKSLYKYKGADLEDYQRINYHLVKSYVDIALLDLERIRWHQKSPQLYVDEAIQGLYLLTISSHAPLNEKRVAMMARMKAVPGMFATAKKNLKKPPSIYLEAAQESLESGQVFYRNVAGELMNRFPDHADQILKVATAAREAMTDFAAWLSELQPGDSTAFAIGQKNFDYKLSHEYFLDIDSDSLLRIGNRLLAEADSAYQAYETHIEENHQNGSDSVYVPPSFSRDDILAYYSWETQQVRLFLEESGFITVPDDIAPVKIVETPSFLRSMITSIAYQPAGPFDSIQQGIFYVRPVPEDLDRRQLEARFRFSHRRGFRGSIVHEAYPGHHLQMQLAGRHPDPVRRWASSIMMIEGWALYSEEAVYRHGLFGEEHPVQWLGVLGGIRFRAMRIVADVMLHTGQLGYNECVDWACDALRITSESEKQFVRREIRRYTLSPTYQMSYLMGKREIMKLREAAMARDGEAFDLRAFHDALLAEGSVPPALMWDVLGL
ncbi:MAG: DUF885 domain-containing protein [candidate division Zixibacteria bacterium]|nr:DUF885 domain-containing protein [candidate division Zixibacteria bacterium]MDH3936692.1 DUF885 domain-containing protein [candidate division Zixibacteria bacterium]MDH4034139.1 DUF885 domain-containing protein [candidate division Zixibacteria bacterium]